MTERTATWRFNVDSPHVRTLVSYGGKLNLHDHFLPNARRRAEEEGVTILDVSGFCFKVSVNSTYEVQASVTVTVLENDKVDQ
jgi:hypothetical protein